jgi:acyl CoA:acetate/3-ketoacid CoA transferase beta subunit
LKKEFVKRKRAQEPLKESDLRSRIILGHEKDELVVISNLGVMNFKNPDQVMQNHSYHPIYTADEIKDKTGFDLLLTSDGAETPIPDPEIIYLISNIYPDGINL